LALPLPSPLSKIFSQKGILWNAADHKILVFVSQKQYADELADKLWKDGFKAVAMHGGKSQEFYIFFWGVWEIFEEWGIAEESEKRDRSISLSPLSLSIYVSGDMRSTRTLQDIFTRGSPQQKLHLLL